MAPFGQFWLDKEKDIVVELSRTGDNLDYCLRTPNHNSGNLIINLAKLCGLPLTEDENGLKIIIGTIPCYVDGENRKLWIFRLGNTKVANIWPDGSVEMKASIPSISKVLMSQTRDYRLNEMKTIVKTYVFNDCKFHTDLHTHMSANLVPDVLIALGIRHQIRYPLYYIKKLDLHITPRQREQLLADRAEIEASFTDTVLTGKYRDRKIDDQCFLNFADLILANPDEALYNISKIRISLAIPKDGQAVFADLEKVYLYRYIFTKGITSDHQIPLTVAFNLPDSDISAILRQMLRDQENPNYRENTLFQNKLLWIARAYARNGIQYAEVSDTALCKPNEAPHVLCQIHEVMPAVIRETGVTLRFLAAMRRTPLTIVRDNVTPNDYLADNLRTLKAVAADPYIAGSDIVGEEINDISELRSVIRELVKISADNPGFVIRIHAGENDSLRDNVAESIRCVRESLAPGQQMPRMRIGHGLYTTNLRSPGGKRLLRELREQNVVLEFQITSNVRLNNLSDLNHHPLRDYLRAGVACVQGTDGGALYGTNPIDEQLSLEKLLELTHNELLQMRAAEDTILEESLRIFRQKSEVFSAQCNGDVAAYWNTQIQNTKAVEANLWFGYGAVNAKEALKEQLAPLPKNGIPVIIAGGSFSGDRRSGRIRPENKALIDRILQDADPQNVFFVIGHRITGYERYLTEQNHGRFQIFAIVPTTLSPSERDRLRSSGVNVLLSIEATGNGVYKSFAYEIFKRRPSVLIAFDGKSPSANLVQEAKNGKVKCRIYIDGRSRALKAKAKALEGYVSFLDQLSDPAETILRDMK